MVKGIVFACELPTCNDSSYDYFVVSHNIAHAVAGVQRLDDSGLNPHHPCRLLVRSDARRKAVRKLARPPKVPPVLPHGPPLRPPDYGGCSTVGDTAKHVSDAMDL